MKRNLSYIAYSILITAMVLTLGACGGSGGGASTPPPTPDADPTGYYDVTGTATVKLDDNVTDLNITDLQGLVNGTEFSAISTANGLVYTGTITNINQNDFTATLSIYRDGALLTTATVAGTITEGSSITGTLTGTGAGNGTFTLSYGNAADNQASALSRVENGVNEGWLALIGGSLNLGLGIIISSTGDVSHDQSTDGGVFNGCSVASGSITPVSNVNIYTVTITLSGCNNTNANGVYNGVATTRTQTSADDRLVLIVSKTDFSIHGEFTSGSII